MTSPLSVSLDAGALLRLKERIRGALAHASSDDGMLPRARPPSPSPSVPPASPGAAPPPLAQSARGIQSAFTPRARLPAARARALTPPPAGGELPLTVAAALADARALRALDL